MELLHRRPYERQLRHVGEVVLVGEGNRFLEHGRSWRHVLDRLAGLEFTEVALDEGARLVDLEVAGDGQGDVVRAVPARIEGAHVFEGGSVQVFEGADDRPAIGVIRRVEGFGDDGTEVAVGAVVHALALLVLHHLFLVGERSLGEGLDEEAELFRLCPDDLRKAIGRGRLVVLGHVVGGEAVYRCAADARVERIEAAVAEVL